MSYTERALKVLESLCDSYTYTLKGECYWIEHNGKGVYIDKRNIVKHGAEYVIQHMEG